MNAIRRATTLLALLALACSDNTGPGVQTQDLEFLEWAAAAPPLEVYRLQFHAYAGVRGEWTINYESPERFLRFRVDEETLVRDAAGDTLLAGDSVQITITVDSTRFIVRFQPEGLAFNPDRPADLNIAYNHADSVYLNREMQIRPWRQELAGDPWEELTPALWDLQADEIEVDVFGFTRYALAVN